MSCVHSTPPQARARGRALLFLIRVYPRLPGFPSDVCGTMTQRSDYARPRPYKSWIGRCTLWGGGGVCTLGHTSVCLIYCSYFTFKPDAQYHFCDVLSAERIAFHIISRRVCDAQCAMHCIKILHSTHSRYRTRAGEHLRFFCWMSHVKKLMSTHNLTFWNKLTSTLGLGYNQRWKNWRKRFETLLVVHGIAYLVLRIARLGNSGTRTLYCWDTEFN